MKLLSKFLKNNPTARVKYINFGIMAANKAVVPFGKFIRHLLVVQGIDPNTQPGNRMRQALETSFNSSKEEKFEENYDFKWVQEHFKKSQKELDHLNLNQDKFRKLTDLSKLDDHDPTYAKPPASPVHPMHELNEMLDAKKIGLKSEGVLNASSLREALDVLKKYAGELDEDEDTFKVGNRNTLDTFKLNAEKLEEDALNVKLDRAKGLAKLMVERGLCDSSPASVDSQVAEIMKWNNESFEACTRVVERHSPVLNSKSRAAVPSPSRISTGRKPSFRRVPNKE